MAEVWSNATGSAILSFSITDFVNVEDFESNYYHYWGSLTTPPCTPAVSWHLAQNTIKVRRSTMDSFRAKTAEWTAAKRQVDATINYRPIQTNPSCISKCASSEELEYCPGDIAVDAQESESNKLMPLYITLGAMVSIALAVCMINVDFKRRSQRFAKLVRNTRLQSVTSERKPAKSEMTKVPTTESMTVSDLTQQGDGADMMIVYEAKHARDASI